ncbi:MAG: type II secretion system protein [Phycisphaerales bacterium]
MRPRARHVRHDRLQTARRGAGDRAFVLAELLCVIALLLVLAVVIAVLGPENRYRSQMAGSLNNLQRLGSGIADYGLQSSDSVVSFTWRAGESRTCDDYAFPVAGSDLDAAANQAVCILRRQTGRTDITQISGWFPHLFYNMLPLLEYLDEPLPSRLVVSPGDNVRVAWQDAVRRDPADPNGPYFNMRCRPGYPSASNTDKRWPFSSSYEMPPAFYSPDAAVGNVQTIAQSNTHSLFFFGASTPLGRRLLSDIRHPSQKAMMYESNQRFFGSREPFFMFAEARVPVLLCDGSVVVRSSSYANQGFQPNSPTSSLPTQVNYVPDVAWETPPPNGSSNQFTPARMRFTRSGLLGRDFGGPEVPWAP